MPRNRWTPVRDQPYPTWTPVWYLTHPRYHSVIGPFRTKREAAAYARWANA